MLDFDFEVNELSALGDVFVNLIYSLALSDIYKKPVGKRVSNHILSKALIESGVRKRTNSRLDRHAQADFAESIIFYAWMKKMVSIEECVDVLRKRLSSSKEYYELRSSSIQAFAALLKIVDKKIWKDER